MTVTVAKPLDNPESNNTKNNMYAKIGDKITITLVANGTISSATSTIASNTITPVLTGSTLVASYIVDSSVSDTNRLAFTINASNEDGLKTVIFTEANLPNSSIIIDNTAPTITLIGKNNTVVFTNSSYTDPGATASDLSYASDITVNGVNNFDINKSGNYTFTYTAPDDEAGNPGPIITRNVIVRDTPPIGITSLIIATDDSTSYAKAGDNLHLTLNVNDTINTYDAQILNAGITSYSLGTTSLYMLANVSSNATTESNATFTITVTNINGTTLTVTEDNLTSSNVFIDTIAPRIQLVGHAEYFIVNGTVDPIIPNVTVTDGDPNYSGGFTLSTNDTNDKIDTAIIGSVYNYTYTADADTAGNPGESVSRIITIIEADPITVTSLSIASSSGNNFANEGKTITVTLETDGSDLGNFTGTLLGRSFTNATSGGDATFTTTVSSNDANGNATFSITATNSSGNRILVTNDDITDTSFVIIDTVKPIIILNGNSDDTVLQGNNYVDLGANVSDPNNSLYTQTVTALPTNLDTSSLGEQNITYSAPPDAAGNVPDSINRTVTVQAKPLGLETLTIESNNTKNNMYAKIGDKITITLVANGTISSATSTIANVASPPLVAFVNDLPSKVPVKLPRSEPSVTSVTVMVLPAFAKLLPEELAILRDVTVIGSASIIVMILLTLSPGFPAVSASAVYV